MSRAHRNRRDRGTRGPTPDAVADALEEVATHDIPGVPSVSVLRTLGDLCDTPITVADRTVMEMAVTDGDPRNGALMTDAHVSAYRLAFERDEACPECGSHKAVFEYRRNHNIWGQETVYCPTCHHDHHHEEWG